MHYMKNTLTLLFDVQSLIYAILCTVKNILTKIFRLQSAKQLYFSKRLRWWESRSALFINQIWTIKSYRNLFASCYSYVKREQYSLQYSLVSSLLIIVSNIINIQKTFLYIIYEHSAYNTVLTWTQVMIGLKTSNSLNFVFLKQVLKKIVDHQLQTLMSLQQYTINICVQQDVGLECTS